MSNKEKKSSFAEVRALIQKGMKESGVTYEDIKKDLEEYKQSRKKPQIGAINQTANPLQKGDTVEILNMYFDPTVVGNYIYSARVLKSSNEELMKYELNGIRLVACYKVDVL